ncbi:MAG: hypothetical protein O2816_08905 [Planctomycetota bacterium]|nr:hypothetical protein [Planctomycetota bacterium]
MKNLALLLPLLAACASEPDDRNVTEPEPADIDPIAAARLLEAMESWEEMALADSLTRLALFDCDMPPPPVLRQSAASTGDHRQKLYRLRVKDAKAYEWLRPDGEDAPVGQVLVKESFHPVEVAAEDLPSDVPRGGLVAHPYAVFDGQVWSSGERGPLFVMAKLDPETEGTDEGWIYGTATPEGELTSAGLIESCMRCHQRDSTTDRQFGLPDVLWQDLPLAEVALMQNGADRAWMSLARQSRWQYPTWRRFDDSARWAPALCRRPPPNRARMSASRDEATHGRKIYSLYAKDRQAYADETLEEAPVGQVLVKESFHAEPVPDGTLPKGFPLLTSEDVDRLAEDDWVPYVRDAAGREFRTGDRGPLFLMMKFAPDTPHTDQGWVYATIDADGVISSAGAIASCIACHQDAPRDRQFGLPPLE